MTHYIKCDYCGRFISYNDLNDHTATHIMISPDSDISYETWETICKKCNEKFKKYQTP